MRLSVRSPLPQPSSDDKTAALSSAPSDANNLSQQHQQQQQQQQQSQPYDKQSNEAKCHNFTVGTRRGDSGGELTSPNYPNSYPTNTICSRLIEGKLRRSFVGRQRKIMNFVSQPLTVGFKCRHYHNNDTVSNFVARCALEAASSASKQTNTERHRGVRVTCVECYDHKVSLALSLAQFSSVQLSSAQLSLA